MKLIKNIVMLVLTFAPMFLGAQTNPVTMTNPNGLTIDTVTNTGSEGPYFKAVGPNRNKVNITLEVTKISGTVGGTIVLQASNNPTYDAATFATIKNWGIDSSVTATNATNNYNFSDYTGSFVYYRVLWTGTGTMSASYKAYAYKSQ